MRLALGIARMRETPAGSGVWVPGRNVRVCSSRSMIVSELMPAREQATEAVSSYIRVENASVSLD